MKVTIFSHNVQVRGYDRYGYDFLKRFAVANFGEIDYRAQRINRLPSRFRKKPLAEIKRTYAACTADGREFRFHRNNLDLFKEAVSNDPQLCDQVSYTEEPMYTPEHVGLKVKEKWQSFDYQIPYINYFNAPGVTKVLNIPPGQGKEQPLYSKVLTPDGWKTMGDLQVGSQVIRPDGGVANVIGVFPQGIKPIIEFTLAEGSKVRAGFDHLWLVSDGYKDHIWSTLSIRSHLESIGPLKLYKLDSQFRRVAVEISSMKLVDECEAQCILLDSEDHLYITDHRIITHNTYCSLNSVAHHGDRLTICIESRFFHLWEEALDPDSDKQVLDLKKEEVLWIQGSKDLKALLQLAVTNQLDGIKVIVVALRTMANYIETYLRFGKDMLTLYPVLPIDFHKVTGTGTALKDEVHLSLYANYMEELFSHVPRRFSLSATLEDGTFKDKVYAVMFPMEERLEKGTPKKYIDVTALMYRLRDASQAKYSVRGSTDYNHNAYEQWIISNRGRLNNYLKLMLDWCERRFLNTTYFEGQKAVIFVSSIEMATEVFNYLKRNIPHWNVSRYAASAGDVYDEAKQADIMITTEKSFSTGFDLPGLVCALLTVSINSYNTNVQILGRLRELRNHPDITPIFDYLVCEQIQKHIDYHEEKKRTIFKDRVKSHRTKYVNIVV